MCLGALSTCMSAPHVYLVYVEARKGCHIPGTGVIDGCELPCGCWGQIQHEPSARTTVQLSTVPSI